MIIVGTRRHYRSNVHTNHRQSQDVEEEESWKGSKKRKVPVTVKAHKFIEHNLDKTKNSVDLWNTSTLRPCSSTFPTKHHPFRRGTLIPPSHTLGISVSSIFVYVELITGKSLCYFFVNWPKNILHQQTVLLSRPLWYQFSWKKTRHNEFFRTTNLCTQSLLTFQS